MEQQPKSPGIYIVRMGNAISTITVNAWTLATGTYDGVMLKLYLSGVLSARQAVKSRYVYLRHAPGKRPRRAGVVIGGRGNNCGCLPPPGPDPFSRQLKLG